LAIGLVAERCLLLGLTKLGYIFSILKPLLNAALSCPRGLAFAFRKKRPAQGMGGIMRVTGEPDGPPTSVGLPICDLGTGV
jgi:hypothetical protein